MISDSSAICNLCRFAYNDYDFDTHCVQLFCGHSDCPVSFTRVVERDDGCIYFQERCSSYDMLVGESMAFSEK